VSDRPLAIRADSASVTYRVYADHRPNLRETLSWKHHAREHAIVEAVRDVSFEVRFGEVIGLIGSNGSGKSSLLRAVAGLQPLSAGAIEVAGEPALLGVGAVLSGRLSGARNVLLGCMALGMTRSEAEDRFDEIVEFAGIRDAIDRPMRTYSSGMRSRLQFAISTAVAPDILLIDETLAVGDRAFKQRSLERIGLLQEAAKVVVLVTHNLGQVNKVCTRAMWMEGGRLVLDGSPKQVIKAYKAATE
jgi:teichoic acid transport system ATP-binding protein